MQKHAQHTTDDNQQTTNNHDHGNPPGLVKHSEVKPTLPPVEHWELILPDAAENEGLPLLVGPDADPFAKEEADEEARLKDDCTTWGVGAPQCPRPVKKPCDPRETVHNMDSWFKPEIYANPHKAQEGDCRSLCEGWHEGREWKCVHYEFKPVKHGSCKMWDTPPESCLENPWTIKPGKRRALDKLPRRQPTKQRGRQLQPTPHE